jgi:hypothetical protein
MNNGFFSFSKSNTTTPSGLPLLTAPLSLGCINANQSFSVPKFVYQIFVKMWGAGGAGGQHSAPSTGGAGGYVGGQIDVLPDMILTFIVGGGGLYKAEGVGRLQVPPFGGGGYCGVIGYGGEGGGASMIYIGAALIAVAAGGGGGGYSWADEWGGAGGGLNGANANAVGNYGLGASQTAGGAGGYGTGSYLKGANGDTPDGGGGGGGGSGYFGGGAGSNATDGAGGGGSSFITGMLETLAGVVNVPGNAADGDRGVAGNGGAYRANGENGKIWVTF